LGARFDRVLAVYSNAVLALRGRVAWAHDWVSDPTLTPLFQALPGASFIVNGAVLPQDSALASAGAELRFGNGITWKAHVPGRRHGSNLILKKLILHPVLTHASRRALDVRVAHRKTA
jgi:uncharacterized protein with beta-barrel porin domain